jgi:antitoxin (DNA-binding transcriptional repressor) of toxin-antitoxin stability system
MYVLSVTAIPSSKARATFPALLDRVRAGEEITITRHGAAVAVLLRPDALRSRRASAAADTASRLREALEAARSAPIPATGLSSARADELVRDIRTDRDAR